MVLARNRSRIGNILEIKMSQIGVLELYEMT